MAVPQGMVANSVAGSAPIPFTVNGTERMRLDATGLQVHDGTATTTAELIHVYDGDVNSDPGIRIQNDVQTWAIRTRGGASDGLGFFDVTNDYQVGYFLPNTGGARFILQDSAGNTIHDFRTSAGVATVHNEQGADIDERWEGDTFPNLMRLDAGQDSVYLHGRASDGGAFRYAEATTTIDLAVSATATNLIPDGAFVLGVLSRVKTLIVFDSTHTTWEVGDGSDTNLWGSSTTLTAGTALGSNDFTAAGAVAFYPAANNVVITPTGGAGGFTSGEIDITVKYLILVDLAAAL